MLWKITWGNRKVKIVYKWKKLIAKIACDLSEGKKNKIFGGRFICNALTSRVTWKSYFRGG